MVKNKTKRDWHWNELILTCHLFLLGCIGTGSHPSMFAHLNTSVSAGRCSPLISKWKRGFFLLFFNLRKSFLHSFNFKRMFVWRVCDAWMIFKGWPSGSGREIKQRWRRCWCSYWSGAALCCACLHASSIQTSTGHSLDFSLGSGFVKMWWVVKIHLDALTFQCVNTHAARFLYI